MSSDTVALVGQRIGDMSDLPEEIRKQIVLNKLDDLEEKIVSTMRNRYEGIANIDEIIVGLYRDYKFVTKDRRNLGSKLYRMQRAGLLHSVPKRKGVYKIGEST